MTPSGIEPATLRLVAQCLNELRHSEPRLSLNRWIRSILNTERVAAIKCELLFGELKWYDNFEEGYEIFGFLAGVCYLKK